MITIRYHRQSVWTVALALVMTFQILLASAFADDNAAQDTKSENARDQEATAGDSTARDKKAEACTKDIVAARALYKSIPTDFRNLKEPVEKITARVHECKVLLDRFRANCGNHLKGNEDVYPMLVRMMVALSAQERQNLRDAGLERDDVQARMMEYYGRVTELCEEFRAVAPKEHPLQAHVIRQTGDGHYFRQEYELAIEYYQRVQKEFPKYDDTSSVLLGNLRCYVNTQNPRDGIAFARKLIKEEYRQSDLPHYYEMLWKLLIMAGKLEDLVNLSEEVARIFPVRQMREGASHREKDMYTRYIGYNGFRRGYSQFALGSVGDALDSFNDHVNSMKSKRGDLEKAGRSLFPELEVFDKRSRSNIRFLQERYGEIPKVGLENIVWASGEPQNLGSNQKVPLGILFRNINDKRSAKFLQALDRHSAEHPDLYRFVVLSFGRPSIDPRIVADEGLGELNELAIHSASFGIDPDARTGQDNFFHACQAMVGSATFAVLDGEGRMRWWQQDPRDMDVNFSTAILERIALDSK